MSELKLVNPERLGEKHVPDIAKLSELRCIFGINRRCRLLFRRLRLYLQNGFGRVGSVGGGTGGFAGGPSFPLLCGGGSTSLVGPGSSWVDSPFSFTRRSSNLAFCLSK